MKIFLLVFVIFLVFSCKRENKIDMVQYRDGKQLLTMNGIERNGQKFKTPRILRSSPDSIVVGEELLVKIFLEGSSLELTDAFFDCDSVTDLAVDTTAHNVSGCSKRLIVENDTVFIGFVPTQPGLRRFSEITILTRDKEKVFRSFRYSFEYKVVDRSPGAM